MIDDNLRPSSGARSRTNTRAAIGQVCDGIGDAGDEPPGALAQLRHAAWVGRVGGCSRDCGTDRAARLGPPDRLLVDRRFHRHCRSIRGGRKIAAEFPTIAFEYGDPSPHFFDEDADERQRVRRNKSTNTYLQVSRVLAISEFIRHDMEWSEAVVLPNGCDHVVDLGAKDPMSFAHRRGRPRRVGTVMRLGEGESRYKGTDIFADLVGRFCVPSGSRRLRVAKLFADHLDDVAPPT